MSENLRGADFKGVRTSSDEPGIDSLRQQIEVHRRSDRSQSCLSKLVTFTLCDDNQSLSSMQLLHSELKARQNSGDEAYIAANKALIERLIASDRTALSWRQEVGHYGTSFWKTASLFLRGKSGMVGAACTFGLDQVIHPENARVAATDFTLGALKGCLLKGVFHTIGRTEMAVAAKGVSLGVTSRAIDLALTRQIYCNQSTGELSLSKGLSTAADSIFDRRAIACDLVIMGASHNLTRAANCFANGAIDRSPLLNTLLTGTTFGLSNGAVQEIWRQTQNGEEFDLSKVFRRAALQGAVDTAAASLGAVQAGRVSSALKRRFQIEPKPALENGAPPGVVDKALQSVALKYIAAPQYELIQKSLLPVESLSGRLTGCKIEAERVALPRPDAAGRYRSFAEFYQKALTEVERPMLVYDLDGHSAQIAVPEAYALELDRIRQLRQAMSQITNDRLGAFKKLVRDPYGMRALPEDVLAALDDLPNRRIVERVRLVNEQNPEDVWNKQQYGRDFSSYATCGSSGEINLFCVEKGNRGALSGSYDTLLHKAIRHEWAHIAKGRFELENESRMFDVAATVERDGYFSRPYARLNSRENWSVLLGEEMLHPDGDFFLVAAKGAPVRTAVLGKTLQRMLEVCPESEHSPYHESYSQRARFIEQEIRPAALSLIASYRQQAGGNLAAQRQLQQLLQYLGG
jgi:hypothetical protein